jgi:GTP-binding protein YchF
MALSVGIVGLPNVGKSTLFKALTKKQVNIANYPFCTVDPNVGVVKVPDERLEKLAKMSNSARIVPTIIEFVDIAGLVRGANKGEGLGNQFLAKIREVDAIVQVVRVFEDKQILHVDENVNPKRDIETINLELIMKDLETVGKRMEKTIKESRSGDKDKIKELEILEKIKNYLETGKLLNQINFNESENKIIKELCLLTAKPMLVAFNNKIENKKSDEELKEILKFLNLDVPFVQIDMKLEAALGELSDEERKNYMKELGIEEDGIDKLIKASYKLLQLITFLTTGTDETRAWTVKENTKAPQAAAVIHTDFEKKFIKAEVINWQKLLEAGSWAKAAEKGWIRIEGKDYVVKDGDVIEFKI